MRGASVARRAPGAALVALCAALVCWAGSAAALYEGKSKVVSVTTQAEFEKEVLNNDGVTMVEFYADCTSSSSPASRATRPRPHRRRRHRG